MKNKELRNLLSSFNENGNVFILSFDIDGETRTSNIVSIEIMDGNIFLKDHTEAFNINE